MKATLLCIAAVFLLSTTPTMAQPYAVSVIDYYNPSNGPHTNPLDALGAPDAIRVPPSGGYSMGAFGWIELLLGQPVQDIAGPDLGVWEETTFFDIPNGWPDESANVYLSLDGIDWTPIGQVIQLNAQSSLFDIAGLGVDGSQYIRIEDASGQEYPDFEGFDLDAVTILTRPSEVPEPGSGIVLLASLIPIICLRARKQA